MATATQVLGKFASELKYEDIPPAVLTQAKVCILDTVAAATFGAQFPWSKMAADYARRYGSGGPCSLFGLPDVKVHAPYAALANGVMAHAFEQDSVRDPGVGSHPGSTLLPALLAACEETGADGKSAVAAFVAGVEVMFRIAHASHHSPEKLGFHAPGLSGTFGAAVSAGRILGLDEEQLVHALGIAGSLSAGLLAFTKSEQGAMVKRLHLGRASESGILAARLALDGYTGPETILEGKFGFLDAFGIDAECEPGILTAGLGKEWETLRICLKRYACHINAHTPVQALRELITAHGFKAADVAHVLVEGSERLMSHHNIPEPGDLMKAQYSVPFCVAVALHRDPDDPRSFDDSALQDPAIRGTCRSLELRKFRESGKAVRSSRVTVKLKDGRELAQSCDVYRGMPANPMSRDELRRKFLLLTGGVNDAESAKRFERLEAAEKQQRFSVA